MRYFFKSINLIGDALCISPSWRQWIKDNVKVEDEVYMQCLPDHTAPLYQGMVRDMLQIKTVHEKPEGRFDFEHTFDVNAAFKLSDEKQQHVVESYADLLKVTLPGERKRPGEYNPRLKVTYISDNNKWMEGPHNTLGSLKDCILISMFSMSCTSRDPKFNGRPNKMLLWPKWKPMFNFLRNKFPDTKIRLVGAPIDKVPEQYEKELGITPDEYMLGIPLNRLALIMKNSKLVVTIDNGMSHMASSQEANMFLMYPKALGLHYILPSGNPNLEYVWMDPNYVSPAQLLYGLRKAVERFEI